METYISPKLGCRHTDESPEMFETETKVIGKDPAETVQTGTLTLINATRRANIALKIWHGHMEDERKHLNHSNPGLSGPDKHR